MLDNQLLGQFERGARESTARLRKSIDRELRERVRASPLSIRCRSGCSNCCDLEVRIGLSEALAIMAELPAEARDALRAHDSKVRSFAAASGARFSKDYRVGVSNCALLAADRSCSVYALRPIQCRGALAIAPAVFCSRASGAGASTQELGEMLRAQASGATDPGTPFLASASELTSRAVAAGEAPAFRHFGFTVSGVMSCVLTLVGNPDFWRCVVPGDPRKTLDALKRAGLWTPEALELIASSGQPVV